MMYHHQTRQTRRGARRDGLPRGGFGERFGGGGEMRGEGRPRRVIDGGGLRLLLLKLLADEPRHGYDIIRAIEERTGGAYAPSPGIVYPTLTMLQDMALIAESPSEGNRRSFAITAQGEAHLAECAEEVAAILARLDAMGRMAQRSDGGPVRRAMSNLRTALQNRVTREGGSDATLHDVAAILDEAAQRIERL